MKSLTYLCLALLCCMPLSVMSSTLEDHIPATNTQVQRVRIDVTTALGYTRHLLLGFTPDNAATDGFDYGYDALNADTYANDSSWMIEDQRYVIQGVGAFNENKTYPLGLFLSDAGNVEFSLAGLEHFDQDINVYIYDAQNGTVTSINQSSLVESMSQGNFTNRFFIAFTDDVSSMNFDNSSQLSVDEVKKASPEISYISSSKVLNIEMPQDMNIEEIRLYSILGQKIKQWANLKRNLSGNFTVSLSNMSKGTYLVSVKTAQGKFNKRLVITK